MRGALLVMHAALAMAESPAGIGSAGGANKATVAAPEALGPRAYGGAGGGEAGAKGHRIARPCMGPMHHSQRASERLLSQKERDIARGTDKMGLQREGLVCQDTERMRPGEGYLPLETAEEGTCRDMGRM